MKLSKILFGVLFVLITKLSFADKFLLAPIVSYNEASQKISDAESVNSQIFSYLKDYWFEGLLSFEVADDAKFGEVNSVVDAERVCGISGSSFILYGYIQKKSNSWYGNLKLYDTSKKKILNEIYVSDNISKYDRFIRTIDERVLESIDDLLGIVAAERDTSRPFEMELPISAFYWNPIDLNWRNAITGIVGGNVGLEFYPPLENSEMLFLKFDWSFRFNISYMYGMGKTENYPADYHAVCVRLPIFFHVYASKFNSFYIGTGFFYEYEFLKLAQNYLKPEVFKQNMFGVEGIFGYRFSAFDNVSFFIETAFDFHLNRDSYLDIRSGLGVCIKMYEKKREGDMK